MRLRQIIILLLLTINTVLIYGFGGKPIPIQDVRMRYTYDNESKVNLFLYDNISGNTNFDYLSYAIPDTVGNQIEYNKTISISESNITLTQMNKESIYDVEILTLSNMTYSTLSGTNADGTVAIKTNIIYTSYTNWGDIKSNVRVITPKSKRFRLEKDESLYNYNGEEVILFGTTNFSKIANVGEMYYQYNGDDIEQYIFSNDIDIAIYGTIDYKRPNIVITTYIAHVDTGKISSYRISIFEPDIDSEIASYSFEIANSITDLPKTGIVAIKARPLDSFVYVNDSFIGKSTEEGLIYIPSLTKGKHRVTVRKESYKPFDYMVDFKKESEDIFLDIKLKTASNLGHIAMTVPDGTNSSVIINGIKEAPTNFIEKYMPFGEYSLKVLNTNYVDYYGIFTLDSTNMFAFTPTMKLIQEPTWADKIFRNYERNTKIFLGLTIAASLASLGTYIYAGEIFDSTLVSYLNDNENVINPPPINLKQYNTAINVYWAGLSISIALALTTGIYYMLWVGEDDFFVENIAINAGPSGGYITWAKKF